MPSRCTIGILTYNEDFLGETHLEKLGIPAARCHIRGASNGGALRGHIQLGNEYVHNEISTELVAIALKLVKDHPDVASICLECTNMPPFAEAIQIATGLPVYDVHTMGEWFYSGLVRRRPAKWGGIPMDQLETRA